LISPYVGKFGKEKQSRLINAQEMLQEAEDLIYFHHRNNANSKLVLIIDSVTALLTREESEAGLVNANFRTTQALPQFLGKLLRRWVGMAQSTNTTMIFINQVRINPMQRFGNPEYQPGGKALKFYCHSRITMRRVKGGRLVKANKQFGIKGYIKNLKNKMGGLEYSEIGYKILFSGTTEFLSVATLKKDDGD
jgi:recombination protein RecA